MSGRKRWGGAIAALAVVIVAGIALLLFANTEVGRIATGRWSFTKSVEVDRGTYYRMKVNLAYKGEPQAFDIVVGCNVRRTRYQDNSSSYEVGMVPTIYGRKLPDGKTLALASPDFCSGETTANRRVGADFTPLAVIYQDETLGFGIAYMTDDAYANPLSELSFGGAAIETASAAEFAAFRKDGPPNAINREAYHSSYMGFDVLKERGIKRVLPAMGTTCRAIARFLIAEDKREFVRASWPEGRPRFWVPDGRNKETYERFFTPARLNLQSEPDGPSRYWGTWISDAERSALQGIPKTGIRSLIKADEEGRRRPSLLYPVLTDSSEHKWPRNMADWLEFAKTTNPIVGFNVDYRGAKTLGFAYCTSYPAYSDLELSRIWNARKGVRLFDGSPIVAAPSTQPGQVPFHENDQYFYVSIQFGLQSLRGDV